MNSSLRCAVYSRYSSDRQSPCSIDDQNRKCQQFAEARGWTVLTEHTYSDAATSGTISDRAGLKKLLAAAETTPRPFDAILVDDSSRLSRKLSDALQFSDRLKFAGVRLVFVSQGFDSDSEQSDILMAVHGITDSQYIRELSKKTFRGIEGKVLAHLHHGGHIFGYKSVPLEDSTRRDQYGRPMITGARLQVEPEQAAIVRKIFQLYAQGMSIKAVTKQLNHHGIASPRPRPGRQQSWAPSSVRHVLQNERYRGIVSYGRTKKLRNPQTGKRIYRQKPEAEWIRVETPEQRIVSDKLWNAVQERLKFVLAAYGDGAKKSGLLRSRLADSPYIFSGILKCSVCGGSFSIVSGAGARRKFAVYGCAANAYRGTCSNTRRVGRDVVERELLAKLQGSVLSPAAVDYVFQQLETELSEHLAGVDGNLERMRRRKATLEAELRNLTRAVADGMDSPSLRQGITERENEISQLTSKTLGGGRDSVHAQIRNLRKFVENRLGDMRRLLSANGSPSLVRMGLAKHIGAITIGPGEAGTIQYKGTFKLLGNDSVSWDGAEGQNRTGYAGLFRAALYR